MRFSPTAPEPAAPVEPATPSTPAPAPGAAVGDRGGRRAIRGPALVAVWVGLFVAAGTPDAIVRKLAQEVEAAVSAPDVIEKFATLDAVKDQNEIAKFQFRASNTWVTGTHSRSTASGFYGAMQEMQHKTDTVLDFEQFMKLSGILAFIPRIAAQRT